MKSKNIYSYPLAKRIIEEHNNYSKGIPTHRLYKGTGKDSGKIFDESNAVDFLGRRGINIVCSYPGVVIVTFDGISKSWKNLFEEPPKGYFPPKGDYGNHVIVKHDNNEFSWYCHLKPKSIKVVKGQEIEKGTLIGKMGDTGISLKPHLHFQITTPIKKWLSDGYYSLKIRWEDELHSKKYIQRFNSKLLRNKK